MLIDDFLPHWDVASHHQIDVEAPGPVAYRAIRQLELARLRVVALLFAVRALPSLITGKARPARSLTIDTMLDLGFVVLAEDPGHELVIGAIGRFWRPTGDLLAVAPDEFCTTDPAGFAKGVMNVAVGSRDDGTCVASTQTRVLCTDKHARRRFSLYWRLVGPFSGAIRRGLLRELKRTAEAASQTPCSRRRDW